MTVHTDVETFLPRLCLRDNAAASRTRRIQRLRWHMHVANRKQLPPCGSCCCCWELASEPGGPLTSSTKLLMKRMTSLEVAASCGVACRRNELICELRGRPDWRSHEKQPLHPWRRKLQGGWAVTGLDVDLENWRHPSLVVASLKYTSP